MFSPFLPIALDEADEDFDDFQHHDICPDCKGVGKYTGYSEVSLCQACDGSGWLNKGTGWNKVQYEAHLKQKDALARRGFGP